MPPVHRESWMSAGLLSRPALSGWIGPTIGLPRARAARRRFRRTPQPSPRVLMVGTASVHLPTPVGLPSVQVKFALHQMLRLPQPRPALR